MTMNPGLNNPPYLLDWIDIRSGLVIKQDTIKSFPANISVPAFEDGIFAHLVK
jgi:hypothetical protein